MNLAAGGSLTEAIDHVIEAKIIRKLRDQFEIAPDQLVDLQEQLAAAWSKLEPGSPTRSLAKLADECPATQGRSSLAMSGTRDRLRDVCQHRRVAGPGVGWTSTATCSTLHPIGTGLSPTTLTHWLTRSPSFANELASGPGISSPSPHDPTERDSDDLLMADRETTLARHLPSIARICQTYLTRLNDEVDLLPVSTGSSACPARHRAIQRAHRGLGWPYAPRPSPTPSARLAAGRRRGPVREPYGQ